MESPEQHVDSLSNHRKRSLNLVRNHRQVHRSDIFDLPHLDTMPAGIDPRIAKLPVLRFHEDKHVICLDEGLGRFLPVRCREGLKAVTIQDIGGPGRDGRISVASRGYAARGHANLRNAFGVAIGLGHAATVDVAGAHEMNGRRGNHVTRIARGASSIPPFPSNSQLL